MRGKKLKFVSLTILFAMMFSLLEPVAPLCGEFIAQAYEIDEIEDIITVEFPLSPDRERSKEINIPGIRRVEEISVDTGEVEYEIKGSVLKITVKNGDYVDIVQDSKTASDVRRAATIGGLPDTVPYNKDGYTGTLYKSGDPYQVVLSGTPADTKTITERITWSERIYYIGQYQYPEVGGRVPGGWEVYRVESDDPGLTVQYNSGGYTGTLTSIQGYSKQLVSRQTNPLPGIDYPGHASYGSVVLRFVDTYGRLYSGTVSKPDTRVWGYEQVYSGTVYGPEIRRYQYTVTAKIVKAKVKTLTYKFERSEDRTRTTTLHIPQLSHVVSVVVDNGEVSYEIPEGGKVTITAKNGQHVDYYIPSKYVTVTDSYPYGTNYTFPSYYDYNDGYYSGSIPKSGSPYTYVVSGSPADLKTMEIKGTFTRVYTLKSNGSSWYVDSYYDIGNPMYAYEYGPDSEGYKGILYSRFHTVGSPLLAISAPFGNWSNYVDYDEYLRNPSLDDSLQAIERNFESYANSYNPGAPAGSTMYIYETRGYWNEGIVSKPDTRTWGLKQDYAGWVYGPTIYLYEYTVTIEYVDDAPKPPGPFINPTSSTKVKGFDKIVVKWNPTDDWGPGTASTRRYDLEFYDGSEWKAVTTINGVNPATEYEFEFPLESNTNKARFRVRAATNLGESSWTYSDEFIVDNTPPTVTANKTTIQQKSTTGDIILTFEDSLSGVNIREYAWHFTDEYMPEKFETYSSAVRQDEIGTWYLWYRAVDNVGNEAIGYFGPYRVLFPEDATITASPSSRDWDNTDVTVNISVSIAQNEQRSNAGGGGGGATDIRIGGVGLENRVIVAGGGGGAGGDGYSGTFSILVGSGGKPGVGGGLSGGDGSQGTDSGTLAGYGGKGGTNSKGGTGGSPASWTYSSSNNRERTPGSGGGGGGGYYGGGGGAGGSISGSNSVRLGQPGQPGKLGQGGDGGEGAPTRWSYASGAGGGGGGGSSYIGGVENGKTIAGDQLMPNPSGGTMIGKSGDGFARITRYIDIERPAQVGDVFSFDYVGNAQIIKLPPGKYKLEVWGAQGGIGRTDRDNKGAYASGVLELDSEETLYIYVGGQGESTGSDSIDRNINYYSGGFNGGGRGTGSAGPGGGGATDIRLGGTDISNRIIVAGGGGGATINATGSEGRGDVTDNINELYQGFNATARDSIPYYDIGGGGGGYYGGAGRVLDDARWSYGGTSYVDPRLTNTVIKTGKQEMPNPSGGTMIGKSGNGYARITVIDVEDGNSVVYYEVAESYDFSYTGQPQSIELEPGRYFLQVWGAQGGTTGGTAGGKGGYAEGYITLTEQQTVWVYVGGRGNGKYGGWNGGGNGFRVAPTLDRIEYSWSTSDVEPGEWQVLEGNQAVLSEEGQWYLHVKAVFKEGKKEVEFVKVFGLYKIDKTKPYVIFEPDEQDWTNQNVIVTIKAFDDLTEISNIWYRVSTNDGKTWSSWNYYGFWRATSACNSTGIYLIEAYAYDKAGNKSDVYRSKQYKIDKTSPSVSFQPSYNYTWSKKHDVIVTVTDDHSGVDEDSLEYAWSTSTSTPSSGWSKFINGGIVSSPEGLGGYYYLHVKATDKVGNIKTAYAGRYYIDNRPPVVTASPPSGEFKATTGPITLTFTDSLSGVKTRQYAWSSSNEVEPSNWSDYTTAVEKDDVGIWYLWYRSEDNVGNVRIGWFGPYNVLNLADIFINATPEWRDWSDEDVVILVEASAIYEGDDRPNKGGGGGGATDIRVGGNSLDNRVIVAGGGGGAGAEGLRDNDVDSRSAGNGGSGGGLSGIDGGPSHDFVRGGTGGTQTKGGAGGSYINLYWSSWQHEWTAGNGGGGGGGYYGGGGGSGGMAYQTAGSSGRSGMLGKGGDGGDGAPKKRTMLASPGGGGGGGSSYIGGVTNGKTIAGDQSMPSPYGGTEIGHSGDGFARITSLPINIKNGDVFDFDYTGSAQKIVLPPGKYKLEVWGAQGGIGATDRDNKGAYASGILELDSARELYVYVGGQGQSTGSDRVDENTNYYEGGFNGGGRGTGSAGPGGGGGTDIRLGGNDISNRIIVAGGGGGATINANGSEGRGMTTAYIYQLFQGSNATAGRTSAGHPYDIPGGGGGYYGGGRGSGMIVDDVRWSYGGTSYVDPRLTDTVIKTGKQEMPNPSGGTMIGKSGNGFARITVIDVDPKYSNMQSAIGQLDFSYTGKPQMVNLPAGIYKLQVWGASGASTQRGTGGKGGYAEGLLELDAPQTLYVYVGGQGQGPYGGWNGGGNGFLNKAELVAVQYSVSASSDQPSSWHDLIDDRVVITETGEWYLHVKAIARANNKLYELTRVFGPYRKHESLPDVDIVPNEVDWTNNDINVTITVTKNQNSAKAIEYMISTDGGKTWPTQWTRIYGLTTTVTLTETGIYKIRARAVSNDDKLGMIKESGLFKINKNDIKGFKITNIRDIRWDDYIFPIAEDNLPAGLPSEGKTIGLGYGVDFEVETTEIGEAVDDNIVIDVSFSDLSDNPLELYQVDRNGNVIQLPQQFKHFTLTTRQLKDAENKTYTWKGYYYLPFTVTTINGSLPEYIKIRFVIQSTKPIEGAEEPINYYKEYEVFVYTTKRTARDDIFTENVR